jgi:hypothetical protein
LSDTQRIGIRGNERKRQRTGGTIHGCGSSTKTLLPDEEAERFGMEGKK